MTVEDQLDPEHRPSNAAPRPETPAAAASTPAPRRGGEQPRGRGRVADDEPRRRRGGDRRGAAGFGDGIERAYCARFRASPPPAFPVQHRTGATTLRVVVVARRPDAVLLCDSAHPHEHRWPTGEPVLTPDEQGQPEVAGAG